MSDRLSDYLDGEPGSEDLSPELLQEVRAWDRLIATLRSEAPGPAPPWLEGKVMAEVRSAGSPGRESVLSWLLRPRMLRASPMAVALPGVALVILALAPWLARGPGDAPLPLVSPATADPVVYVQFVFEAPGVRSVAVAGAFSEWDQRHPLEDADGDGVWIGRVPVLPGVHEYMFIVNGDTWVTDPRADRYVDDGFGNRNAVLAVASPSRS